MPPACSSVWRMPTGSSCRDAARGRHPVATGDGDHLPVPTQGFDLVAHAGDGIRDRHQPRRLAGRQRPDWSEEVDEDRHAHREQRAEDNGDRDHCEGGAFPVGDEPGHDDRCGPADDAGDEQCHPAPPGAEQATGHEHDEQAEECAEDQPNEDDEHGAQHARATAAPVELREPASWTVADRVKGRSPCSSASVCGRAGEWRHSMVRVMVSM